MKQQIKAEKVAHSIGPQGDELISILATFPRIILAEVNTHRMLSKNTSSSRAIPFSKMVEAIENNPFIPIAFQKSHSGMQGTEYLTGLDYDQAKFEWLEAKDRAIEQAQQLDKIGTTKQLCNRLLEPFMWTTMLITGPKSGWDNFFHLRCPQYNIGEGKFYKSKKDALKDVQNRGIDTETAEMFTITDFDWLKANKGQAEIHMMALAEAIWDAVNESSPRELKEDEWHIPFLNKISSDVTLWSKDVEVQAQMLGRDLTENFIKASVAMAARTSYTVVGEEKAVDYEALIGLHDRLLAQTPPHSSPLEHCARVMDESEYVSFQKGYLNSKGEGLYPYEGTSGWCNNFKGFIPYRYMVDNSLPF